MGKKRTRQGEHVCVFLACIAITTFALGGCAVLDKGQREEQCLKESRRLMISGDYQASLKKYQEVFERFPRKRDQAVFRMAVIHAYPKNKGRDYQKSLEYLQKLLTDYPQSDLRDEAEILITLITQVTDTEQRVRTLQKHMDVLERHTDALENQIEQMKRIDLSTEERKRKRLEQ